ncbi:glycosyl hydrolase family 28-related protein [Priestia megaterium]|uniref:glycosyl hydrolase family 28-related protein n=1 Tax=Priestia megaterium TaxID=1404 RepID=UPI0038783A8F
MYQQGNFAEKVYGNNVIKQGESTTLRFKFRNDNGELVNLNNAKVQVEIISDRDVALDKQATVFDDYTVEFEISFEDIFEAENMCIQFVVVYLDKIQKSFLSEDWQIIRASSPLEGKEKYSVQYIIFEKLSGNLDKQSKGLQGDDHNTDLGSVVKELNLTSNEVNSVSTLSQAEKESIMFAINNYDIYIRQFGVNIKQPPFNAKGDGVTDDTIAIQMALEYASANRIGNVFFPKGNYLVSKSITVSNRAMLIHGLNTFDTKIIVAPNFANSTKGKPVFLLYSGTSRYAIDKINIRNIGFDASNDNMNTRGIQFEYLIYTSSFEYLDFEGFSGAAICSDGLGNDVSEMITFHQIRIHPRGKVRFEPAIKLRKVNEVVFMNNRFFAKEKGSSNITNQPLLKLQGCQGVHIQGQNSFFYSDESPAISVLNSTGDNATQGIFIGGNTFELCGYIHLIEVSGLLSNQVTDLEINRNRYNNTSFTLSMENVINAMITDLGLNVILNKGVDGCTIFTNSTYGKSVTDVSGGRNVILDVGSDYNNGIFKVRSKLYNSYISLESGVYPLLKFRSKDTPTGKEPYVQQKVPNGDWAQRQLIFNNGEDIQMVLTANGLSIPTVPVLPSNNIVDKTLVFNSTDSTLCFYINGVWKKTKLT